MVTRFNVFDLDTDNDGIYDVIESGNSSLDTDSDGRINDVAPMIAISMVGMIQLLILSTQW